MAKRTARKNRAAAPAAAPAGFPGPAAAPAGGEEPRKSLPLWISALILIVSGYALLHKADPGGQNAWAIVSPALLLCGYLLIIPAILVSYRK